MAEEDELRGGLTAQDLSEEQADSLRAQMDSGGMLGSIGLMVGAAFGAMAMRKGAGSALRRASSSRGFKKLAQETVEEAGRLSKGLGKAAQKTKKALGREASRLTKKGSQETFSFSRVADDLGFSTPKKIKQEGEAWRALRKSKEAKSKGTLGALWEKSGSEQRKLIKSGLAEGLREEAVAFPLGYAADASMGLTGPPGEMPAAWDVPGHMADMAEYAPSYAGYAAAGSIGMGVANAALRGGMRAVGKSLAGNSAAAGLLSKAWGAAERAQRKSQDASGAWESQWKDMKDAPLSERAKRMPMAIKEEASALWSEATKGVSRSPMIKETSQDPSLSGARKFFREKSHARQSQPESPALSLLEASPQEFDRQLRNRLSGGASETRTGGLFEAENVTIRQARKEGLLGQKAESEIRRIEDRVQRLKSDASSRGKMTQELEGFSVGDIPLTSVGKVGDESYRMPTGGMVRARAMNTLARTTTFRRGFTASRVVGMSPGESRPSDFHWLRGETTMPGDRSRRALDGGGSPAKKEGLFHFGDPDSAPAQLKRSQDGHRQFQIGLAEAVAPGRSKQQWRGIGVGQDKGARFDLGEVRGILRDSSPSAFRMRLGKAKRGEDAPGERPTTSQEDMARRAGGAYRGLLGSLPGPVAGMVESVKEFGSFTSEGLLSKAASGVDALGSKAPRRLFGEKGGLWSANDLDKADPGQHPLTYALEHLQTAWQRSSSVVTSEGTLGKAMKTLDEGGEIFSVSPSEVHRNPRKALQAVEEYTSASGMAEGPSRRKAEDILRASETNPHAVHNAQGKRRADILQQHLVEQAAAKDDSFAGEILKEVNRKQRAGGLTDEAAAEARAGLTYMEIVGRASETGPARRNVSRPYQAATRGGALSDVEGFEEARQTLMSRRDELQEFAATRQRVDPAYARKRFMRSKNDPQSRGGQADLFAVKPGWQGVVSLRGEQMGSTARRVLGEIGLGWDESIDTGSLGGLKKLGKIWAKRGLVLSGAAMAYRTVDTGTDLALPDQVPLVGEGITRGAADLAASAALGGARVRDALGITGAAQYMEGLLPKSTTMAPGAALGGYLGGPMGALAGAAAGRIGSLTLRNTPFEALGATPLAPFVTDLTETSEELEAELEGDKLVPFRRSRNFLLSATPYAGDRITSWRPSWYASAKSDWRSSDVMYGSRIEEYLFKDLPLIDVAPGDLLAPNYLQNKHRDSRPYTAPSRPFEGVPIVGPTLASTVGAAYLFAHPLGSNEPQHMASHGSSGGYASSRAGGPGQGYSVGGGTNLKPLPPMPQRGETAHPVGRAEMNGSATVDEQFYRLSEAVGFQGFLAQEAVGGEGIFRRRRHPSAGRMDSSARRLEEAGLGDLFGIGEALRRLYPYEREKNNMAQGPRNNMASWLATGDTDYTRGDPYCVHPKQTMEVRVETKAGVALRVLEAKEVHERVQNGEYVEAWTHRSRWRQIKRSATREVDEDLVRLSLDGLPDLLVTEGHPVRRAKISRSEWTLAGDVEKGHYLLEPAAQPSPARMGPWAGRNRWQAEGGAAVVEAALQLRKTQPPPGRKWSVAGLSQDELFRLEQGFGLPGSKYDMRCSKTISASCRLMAEEGMTEGIEGAPPEALFPLLKAWGQIWQNDQHDLSVEFEYDIELWDDYRPTQRPRRKTGRRRKRAGVSPRIVISVPKREKREKWRLNKPYEPEATDKEYERALLCRLRRIFSAAGAPGHVSGGKLILTEAPARRCILGKWQRSHDVGKYRLRWGTKDIKTKDWDGGEIRAAERQVTDVSREPYEGKVYAFEVEEDESFCASGVATHNSKVAMGETLLPGEGFERTQGAYGEATLEAEDVRSTREATTRAILGYGKGETKAEGRAKKMMRQRLMDMQVAIREKAVFTDGQNRVTATADAATQQGQPIQIEAVSEERFDQIQSGPSRSHAEQLNVTMGAAGRQSGMLAYVSTQTGRTKTFSRSFNEGQYHEQVSRLQASREEAYALSEQGYGRTGEMYGPATRMRVLMNAAPFSDEYDIAEKQATQLMEKGAVSGREAKLIRQTKEMHQKMSIPFEAFPKRFRGRVFNPSDHYPEGLNYNDDIKAASEYSLPERALGAAYGYATSLRNPLTTKLFGNFSPSEQYERRILLGRDFQSWSDPAESFVDPYLTGLRGVEDPVQGAMSYGIGGSVLAGNAFGALGATVGAAYGAVRGAASASGLIEGGIPVDEDIQQMRQLEAQVDRLKYGRAMAFESAGISPASKASQETTIGWLKASNNPGGSSWAKETRERRQDGSLPPELYTAFKAAPKSERDFLKIGMKLRDEAEQRELTELTSDRFSSVLETSWQYTQGREVSERTREIASENPRISMGDPRANPGERVETMQIRSILDSGLSSHDAGLGWKMGELRQAGVLERPGPGVQQKDRQVRPSTDPAKLEQVLKGALRQMNVNASVEVEETGGASQMLLIQR